MRQYGTVAKRQFPCVSYRRFKILKISAFDCGTVSMRRQKLASADKFLAMVTEGVVHGVYKVLTRSVFRCNMAT